jgi:hypothetical protein
MRLNVRFSKYWRNYVWVAPKRKIRTVILRGKLEERRRYVRIQTTVVNLRKGYFRVRTYTQKKGM